MLPDVARPPAKLAADAAKIKNGEVLHTGGATDPKAATRKLLEVHPDARFDYVSARLTLPPVSGASIASTPSMRAAAAEVARQTGVTKVTAVMQPTGKVAVKGQIHPETTVATIHALVPFHPIHLRPAMSGGEERLQVRPTAPGADGKAELWVANQKGVIRFDHIASGPIGKANNAAGLRATRAAHARIEKLVIEIAAVQVIQGMVPEDKLRMLRIKAEEASTVVSQFGHKLRIHSLQGADHARPAKHQQSVQFARPELKDWKVPYVSRFTAEMVRRLQQQETGLNKLSIDEWVVHRELFNPSQHLDELDATAKQAVLDQLHERCKEGLPRAQAALTRKRKTQQDLDQVLQALQSGGMTPEDKLEAAEHKAREAGSDVRALQVEIQSYIAAGAMDTSKIQGPGGRENARAAWSRKHSKAKEAIMKLIHANDPMVAEWVGIVRDVGDLAVLHDPDPIAGGHGDIEKLPVAKEPTDPNDTDGHEEWRKYLLQIKAHLGVKDIHGSIGSQSKERIANLSDRVTRDPENPQEAHAIRTMNVKFIPGH